MNKMKYYIAITAKGKSKFGIMNDDGLKTIIIPSRDNDDYAIGIGYFEDAEFVFAKDPITKQELHLSFNGDQKKYAKEYMEYLYKVLQDIDLSNVQLHFNKMMEGDEHIKFNYIEL